MTLTFVTPLITAWVLLNNVVTELTLRASVWLTITFPMLFPSQPGLIPMKLCMPNNDVLRNSELGKLVRTGSGAVGGVVNDVVTLVVIIMVIAAAFMAPTKRGGEFLKRIGNPPLALVYGLLILIGLGALVNLLGNRC